jgi:PAS domain S-box-containing protein
VELKSSFWKVTRKIGMRRQADRALERQAETLRQQAQLLDLAHDPIISSGMNGTITYWNRGAEERYGWSRAEAMGKNSRALLQTQFPNLVQEIEAEFLREGRWEGELVQTRRDGSQLVVASRWALQRDEHGKPLAILEINSDITERKRAEEERTQLLAREKAARAEAEAANRLKDEFLATLSHELRTPLSSILKEIRLLRTSNCEKTRLAQALESIEQSAKLQAQLIEDLLGVSHIITGKLRLDICQVEIVPVIEAAVNALRPAAEAKGIEIERLFDPFAVPASVDPNRLQQVVWNLLSNAIKFTPPGGRVQIRLEHVESEVRIAVSDTGKGIRADFLPYVFDRFCQSESSGKRAQSGLGLGLAIVRHLVELHGGTVHVESPGEGMGTCFTVRLPLVRVPYPEAPPARVPERRQQPAGIVIPFDRVLALKGLRVLVVDDEADSRELLTSTLGQRGAGVTAVASAGEALDALVRVRPDVLVSAIEMPEEDGYTLMRKVRALKPEQGREIPAVALSAYVRAEDRVRSLAAGFQAHVRKPVEPAELVAVVTSLAGRTAKT